MTRTVRRAGFTLVELLVVIALIIVLAALTAAVVQTGMLTSQKVVSAADRASGWLLIAKQRAMRDGAPRGVRFLMTPDPLANPPNSYFRVTDAQYIESPEPWIPNPDSTPNGPRIVFAYVAASATSTQLLPPPNGQRVFFVSDQSTDIIDLMGRVSANDMLVLPEFGSSFRLSGDPIAPPPGAFTVGGVPLTALNARELPLAVYPDLAAGHSVQATPTPTTMATNKFAIQPQPRPLLGEPTVQLTGNTVIDFRLPAAIPANPGTTAGVILGTSPGQAHFDILFAPSGSVMDNPFGLICLWVRDPDLTPHPRRDPTTGSFNDYAGYNAAGEQVLVTIYTQTGLISTHPVNPPPAGGYADPVNEPYLFARDGASSGL